MSALSTSSSVEEINTSEQETDIFSEDGCEIRYTSNFFSKEESDEIYDVLYKNARWQDEKVRGLYAVFIATRKTAYYGTASYSYSGYRRVGQGWPEWLIPIKEKVENYLGCTFNFVLMNFYRDGEDYVGYHTDQSDYIVPGSVSASLSFGSNRDFCFQKQPYGVRDGLGNISFTNKGPVIKIVLTSGSLLVMNDKTQEKYKHSIPKRMKCKEGRINITFRNVVEGRQTR